MQALVPLFQRGVILMRLWGQHWTVVLVAEHDVVGVSAVLLLTAPFYASSPTPSSLMCLFSHV